MGEAPLGVGETRASTIFRAIVLTLLLAVVGTGLAFLTLRAGGPSDGIEIVLPTDAPPVPVVVHVAGAVVREGVYSLEAGDRVLDSGFEIDTASYAAWRRAIDRLGLPRIVAREGQSIALGDVVIEVLHPPKRHLARTEADSNNNSIVLRVSYGEVSFLLTGDVFELAEEYLLSRDGSIDSTVLKIAHHGSSSSSGDAFLDAVLPEVAVISVAAEDAFGHPHDTTLARLLRHVPEETLMTSRDGAVRLRTDGRRLWVETER